MLPRLRCRNVYENVVQKNRLAEENRISSIKQNKIYFENSKVKAVQENQWTSERSFNASMMAYLQPDRETLLKRLEDRQNKLMNLLNYENKKNKDKLSLLENSENTNYSKLQREYKMLSDNRELARDEKSKYLLHQRFIKEDPEMINNRRELENRANIAVWDEQISAKNNASNSRLKESLYDEEVLLEQSRKQEEYDKHIQEEQTKQNKEHFERLQKQIEEIKQRENDAKELNCIKEQLISEQIRLSELDLERQVTEKKRNERQYGKSLLRQSTAALKRRSRQVQEELQMDMDWLSKLAEQANLNTANSQDQTNKLRSEAMAMRAMVQNDLQNELIRETNMDELYAQEASEVWKKQSEQWNKEQAARQRLLNEIIESRKKQVSERLNAVRQLQAQQIEEREQMLKELENENTENRLAENSLKEFKNDQKEVYQSQTRDKEDQCRIDQHENRFDTDVQRQAEDEYATSLREKARTIGLKDVFNQPMKADKPSQFRGNSVFDHRKKTHLW